MSGEKEAALYQRIDRFMERKSRQYPDLLRMPKNTRPRVTYFFQYSDKGEIWE